MVVFLHLSAIVDFFLEADQVFRVRLGVIEDDKHGWLVDVVGSRVVRRMAYTPRQDAHFVVTVGSTSYKHLALVDIAVA